MASQLGLIGLAVMGQNLALNIADHGFTLSVYNRSCDKTQQFQQQHPHENIHYSLEFTDFIQSLNSPKIIILMVQAGNAIDALIAQIQPYLDQNDILIDGGNSHYNDTERRYQHLKKQAIRYVGMGISGGEEGARFGPAIMPGGDKNAWPIIASIFQTIAAQVDNTPCCTWIGEASAGHYVKMVHNGIEYGDMQLIAEAYAILRYGLGLNSQQLADTFTQWNQGVLNSYLIEITADILHVYEGDSLLIDKILDRASQKGTGKWTVNSALDEGQDLGLITQAVFARFLSAHKPLREKVAQNFSYASATEKKIAIQQVHDALYAAKIISYTQGFMLLQAKAGSSQWQLNYADIAKIWRGGCIIRSQFLNDIANAYTNNSALECLLLDEFFQHAMTNTQNAWRQTVCFAISQGIATPAMSSALAFFDGIRQAQSPANLIQAQRDYFGAHTYQRIDQPEKNHHTDWQKALQTKESL